MDKNDPKPPTKYLEYLDLLMHLGAIGLVGGIFAKVMFF